jgi:V/A-type H+-transporting ATPase subunit E
LNTAKKEKENILAEANKQALEIKKQNDSELQLAARQFTSNLKQKITSIIVASQTEELKKDAFNDKEFLKQIILTTILNWNPQKTEELDLRILLPKKDEFELASFLENKTLNALNKGVTVEFDSETKDGFKIAPKNGNYTISFSAGDFENFFKSYFREKTKELLFESEK